jgi:hypothetical protein
MFEAEVGQAGTENFAGSRWWGLWGRYGVDLELNACGDLSGSRDRSRPLWRIRFRADQAASRSHRPNFRFRIAMNPHPSSSRYPVTAERDCGDSLVVAVDGEPSTRSLTPRVFYRARYRVPADRPRGWSPEVAIGWE